MKYLTLIILLLSTQFVQGQSGTMKGKVFISGNKLPLDSVVVEMVGSDTTIVFMTESDSDGNYEFIDLPASEYVIQYSRKGYDAVKVAGIILSPKRITNMDAHLMPSKVERESKRSKVKRN